MSDDALAACAPSPAEELASFVAWTSALFFHAENGHNPQVATYWDAFHYVSTSLSVGYANIFPTTQLGRLIGGVVMMVGPALSARALDAQRVRPDEPTTADVVVRLDAILAELRALNAARSPA